MGGLLRQILGTGRSAILPAAFLCATAIPAGAQGIAIDHAHQYAACMTLARATPKDGFEKALAWSAQGGGQAARHCAAVALVGLGQYEEAAVRLERLAQEATAATAKLRPDLLAQSGQAWLMAGEYMRAHAVQSAALKLAPDNVELLIDRSITLASAANYWEAVDDLSQALDLAPERADVSILRAAPIATWMRFRSPRRTSISRSPAIRTTRSAFWSAASCAGLPATTPGRGRTGYGSCRWRRTAWPATPRAPIWKRWT